MICLSSSVNKLYKKINCVYSFATNTIELLLLIYCKE